MAALSAAPPVAAAESPRAAVHETYARVAFDWSGPIRYSAEVVNDAVVVRFEQPIEGDFRAIPRRLSGYVSSITLSADRRVATFRLSQPVTLKSFTLGNTVVIDMFPAAPAAPAAAPQPQSGSAEPSLAGDGRVAVGITTTEEAGFQRIVFNWPIRVDYRTEKNGGSAKVAFDSPGLLDMSALSGKLPTDIGLLAGSEGTSAAALLTVPPESRLRHFRNGNTVVIDIVRPAASLPPGAAENAPIALAPPPGEGVELPALAPLIEEQGPQINAPTEDAPAIVEEPVEPETRVSLSFSWGQPVGAAVFRRAGWFWVVFDRRQEVDTRLLRRLGGDIVTHVEQIDHQGATAVRMLVSPDYNPTLRKDGLLWVLDFARQPLVPVEQIQMQIRRDEKANASLFMPVPEGGSVVTIEDPEVGDRLFVVPLGQIGLGVAKRQTFPEAELLATAQGVAIVPITDAVDVRSNRIGVELSIAPASLSVSNENERFAIAGGMVASIFDLGTWQRGGPQNMESDEPMLQTLVGTVSPDQRSAARLDLARYYLANGYAAEAIGVLRVMEATDPVVVMEPEFRAVRGATDLMLGRYQDAADWLNSESLDEYREIEILRSLVEARLGQPGKFQPILSEATEMLKQYSAPVKLNLGQILADIAIESADDLAARDVIASLASAATTAREKAMVGYLEARYDRMTGATEGATRKFETTEKGPSRLYRAKAAWDRIEIELASGALTPEAAIEQLEKLRFAWRDPDFEFPLLRRIGELHLSRDDYARGLRTFRELTEHYADHRDIGLVRRQMASAFEQLYVTGDADKLPPVTAIALFDEFSELVPSGPEGDEMMRRLADRLAAVDLLDRAADLLRRQIAFRLDGPDRSRVGAQLALVELLNRQPDRALKTLSDTTEDGMTPELREQRRHLRAQALEQLGESEDAISLLAGDESEDGRLLRAEIEWRRENWREAAAALSTLVAAPRRGEDIDERSAKIVQDWVTALTLAGDERGIMRVRRQFGPAMQDTRYRDAFNLLTAQIETGVIDYRSVADKIQEAEAFQSFMAAYRERLQTQGLSGIN